MVFFSVLVVSDQSAIPDMSSSENNFIGHFTTEFIFVRTSYSKRHEGYMNGWHTSWHMSSNTSACHWVPDVTINTTQSISQWSSTHEYNLRVDSSHWCPLIPVKAEWAMLKACTNLAHITTCSPGDVLFMYTHCSVCSVNVHIYTVN